MKVFIVIISLCIVAAGSVFAQNDQVSEKVKRENARLLDLASQYHASVDWLESLPDRGLGEVFTIDLTKALIRTNAQPVAMEAFLEDVSERDGVFTGFFTLFDVHSHHTFNLNLVLRCSKQQTADLLKVKPSIGDAKFFAVVATVESVSRPAFEAENSDATDNYHIDFSSIPNVFFAKGNCVELVPLEF